MLLAMSLMILSEQLIINKIPLNRNTHKTRYILIHVTSGLQNPNPVYFPGVLVQYCQISVCNDLWNRTTVNN